MNPGNIDELWMILKNRLSEAVYFNDYKTESDFEVDVWKTVVRFANEIRLDPKKACLTSHAMHENRDAEEWQEFCKEEKGPDVNVLRSNNRLDIVLRHPQHGSIGIEIKCLGESGHAAKLTQGLGQALLGLVNRDRTILVINCGTVGEDEREQLKIICNNICDSTKTAVVVVP